MPLTSNVVASTPITSTWGNAIRDRTVQRFTSAAERASAWTSPGVGAVSHLADSPGRLWVYNGTAWGPVGNYVHSYLQKTSDQLNISAITDVSGLTTASLALIAGRRYELFADVNLSKDSGDSTAPVGLYITDSTNATIYVSRVSTVTAAGFQPVTVTKQVTGLAAGNYIFKVRVQAIIAGQANVNATATQPAIFSVTDVGPA